MKGQKPVTNTNPPEVDTEVVGKTLTQIALCYLASNIIDHRQTIASRKDHELISTENSRRWTSDFDTWEHICVCLGKASGSLAGANYTYFLQLGQEAVWKCSRSCCQFFCCYSWWFCSYINEHSLSWWVDAVIFILVHSVVYVTVCYVVMCTCRFIFIFSRCSCSSALCVMNFFVHLML